ncbi:hypothetical protein [Haladaptatus sp. CMAA 1911]|uniref:hypothetical protein n=1 Tax=unclassified Haladaptatus TaxID=2622732 RepID=UPI0037545A38
MARKRNSLVLVLLVLLQVVVGSTAGVGTVAAAENTPQLNVCNDPIQQAFGALIGFTRGGISGVAQSPNPCIRTEDIADVDTTEEAKRVLAQEALEDKRYWETYLTQFNTYQSEMKNPAYSDARIAFMESVANGSDRVAAVTDARRAVHNRTTAQQRELWIYYGSMADSIGRFERLAEDKGIRGESLRIGKVNESGSFVTGYSFDTNQTENLTLSDGSNFSVPVASNPDNSSDTVNPLTDDLLVRVWNPEGANGAGAWIDLMNTGSFDYLADDTQTNVSQTGSWELAQVHQLDLDLETAGNFGAEEDRKFADVSGGELWYDADSSGGVPYIQFVAPGESFENSGSWTRIAGNGWGSDTITVSVVVNDDGSTTISGPSGSETFDGTGGTLELNGTPNSDVVSVTPYSSLVSTSYTNTFAQKHDALEGIDNDVLSGLGDSNSGYLSDAFDAIQSGDVNITDVANGYDRVRMTPDDVDQAAYANWMREQMGLGTAEAHSRLTITVHEGAEIDGDTIESERTFEAATIWASTPPASGSWNTSTTYSVDNLGGVVGLNYEATDSHWEDGQLVTDTTSQMVSIQSGSFTVESITTEDGENVDTIDHDDRDPQTTNVTEISRQLEELAEANERLREELADDDPTFGGINIDWGNLGGDGPWLPDGLLPDLSLDLPFLGTVSSEGVLLGAVALVAGGVGLVYLQMTLGNVAAVVRVFTGGRS